MSSNSLKLLPAAMSTLTKLKTLRLDANKLEVRARNVDEKASHIPQETVFST